MPIRIDETAMQDPHGGQEATAVDIWRQGIARKIEASCSPWIGPMMIDAHEILEGRNYQERIARLVNS